MIKRVFYGWWVTLACSFIGLYVAGVIFFGFTAFFEPIAEEFNWNYTQISFAVSLRGLEMGVFAPFVGFLSDYFGTRKVIFWGIITVGIGLILLSQTQSLTMFYGSFLLLSFGAGGCTAVVTTTAVANWFHKKAGIALGVMGSGIGAGGLMVLLIVRLIELYQWRTTLIILGLGMWAIGIPLSLVIRDRPENYGYLPDGEVSVSSGQSHKSQDKVVEIGLKEALKMRTFLYLNLIEAVRMMILMAVFTHLMPYLSSVGMPRSSASMVTGAIPLIGIIGRFGFGWLGDIYDKRHVMALTLGLITLGVLAFSLVHVRLVMLPFLLLFPLGHGGSMIIRGAILREYFGRDSFGKMIGVIMGSASIGGIIGPTLAGWAYDTWGSYQLIWHVFLGFLVIAFTLTLKMKPVAIKNTKK
ncbi:MAG: MFS transporter [Deltaproteobacteria bacterium]|nr:MAG: MFS transporter [Deltaproteobacteria bacterium]